MKGVPAAEHFDWTPAREAELARLHAQVDPVLSFGAIAAALGCSKNSVVGKAHRLNLPARPSPIATLREPGKPRKPPTPPRAKGPTLAPLKSLQVAAPKVTPPAPVLRKGPALPCCFPIGEPRTPEFRYCDAPVERQGRSYCDMHHAIAWRPAEVRRVAA